MKKIVKINTIMLLLIVFFLIGACAKCKKTDVTLESGPVINRILERGELIVGISGNQPPLNMTTKDGKIIGLEPDLAELMARAMNVSLKIEDMSFHELLPALENGKIDMVVSGMTITSTRNLKVAFVGPYFISGKSFITKYDTIAAVKDVSDVNHPNMKMSALKGSTSELFVKNVIPRAELVTTNNYDEAMDMVLEDKVDAMVADYPFCLFTVLRYRGKGLTTLITPLTFEPLGIAVPANDPLLINWMENFLNTLDGSGGLEKLKKRWFENPTWIKKLP